MPVGVRVGVDVALAVGVLAAVVAKAVCVGVRVGENVGVFVTPGTGVVVIGVAVSDGGTVGVNELVAV